jgi:hypothetical protein
VSSGYSGTQIGDASSSSLPPFYSIRDGGPYDSIQDVTSNGIQFPNACSHNRHSTSPHQAGHLGTPIGIVPPRIKRVTWEHRTLLLLTLPDAKILLDNRYTPFPVNPDAASPLLTPSNRCPSWAVHLSSPPPPPLRRPPLVTVRFILVLGRPTGGPLHFNVDRR